MPKKGRPPSPKKAEALKLHYQDGLAPIEISEKLDIALRTVQRWIAESPPSAHIEAQFEIVPPEKSHEESNIEQDIPASPNLVSSEPTKLEDWDFNNKLVESANALYRSHLLLPKILFKSIEELNRIICNPDSSERSKLKAIEIIGQWTSSRVHFPLPNSKHIFYQHSELLQLRDLLDRLLVKEAQYEGAKQYEEYLDENGRKRRRLKQDKNEDDKGDEGLGDIPVRPIR